MNIKEHIEAGHYAPFMGGPGIGIQTESSGTAQIFTSSCGGLYPIVGVVSVLSQGWVPMQWAANGAPYLCQPEYQLLPPPPRKVEVKAWAQVAPNGDIRSLKRCADSLPAVKNGRTVETLQDSIVELTGSYEEPW